MNRLRPLIRTLERRDRLSPDELALLSSAQVRVQGFRRGQEILRAKTQPGESCLMLQGISGREMVTAEGKRQISALHVAGDFVDLHSFVLKRVDHAVVALTEVTAIFVLRAEIRPIIDASPHLGRLFWLMTTIDGAIQRAWIVCLGRSTAMQHMSHLFCELWTRMEIVGMVSSHSFPLRPTQAELADVVGLSAVHVSRMLQELRGLGVVDWNGEQVEIIDFECLVGLVDFDKTCLNLIQEPR
jgi:CRP-like cAMP-binding protein